MTDEQPGWDDLDWAKLGEWVYARRRNRGMRSRELFAVKAGVSSRTLGDLERGLPVSPHTLLAVDAALFWVAGSCERILRGQDPIEWPHQAPGFWDDSDEPEPAEENSRPEGEIDRRSVGELVEAGEAPLLSIDPEALRGLTHEQQAVVIREAQEHALRTARLLRGER